jgi:UDP-N-acetylmuramate--alanine ligase
VPKVVRGEELPPADDVDLALPGEYNRRNAACALAALDLVGVSRTEAARTLAEFRGLARRFERRGGGQGVRVLDDYAHHPTEIAAVLGAARQEEDGKILVAFQPHLFSRTRHLARELAEALTAADAVCVTEIYPAREEPVAGVTGKLVVDALSELRPGIDVGWTPTLQQAAAFLVRRARPGDTVLTVGAGDVDRVAELVVTELDRGST